MNTRDLLVKWIAELRSGKYAQGQKRLRTPDDKFCCLGVLCDIVGEGNWEKNAMHGEYTYVMGPHASGAMLPISEVFSPLHRYEHNFVKWNDENRWDFKEIADEIESTILPLFPE